VIDIIIKSISFLSGDLGKITFKILDTKEKGKQIEKTCKLDLIQTPEVYKQFIYLFKIMLSSKKRIFGIAAEKNQENLEIYIKDEDITEFNKRKEDLLKRIKNR
jgi:hypothetical protein